MQIVQLIYKIGEDILDSIKKKIPKAGTNIYITASIGFCIYPDDGADIEDLLRMADKAMYKVKMNNKNGYNIYSSKN
jgi:diguanylate cyclase (GGDEF)-like protein